MKRYAFLRLEHGANKVVFETKAPDFVSAVRIIKDHVTNVELDADGYGKLGNVTFCVAEFFEPFYTV